MIKQAREKIAQETRTLLFGYNVGTDYIEPISSKFADKILDIPLTKVCPCPKCNGGRLIHWRDEWNKPITDRCPECKGEGKGTVTKTFREILEEYGKHSSVS